MPSIDLFELPDLQVVINLYDFPDLMIAIIFILYVSLAPIIMYLSNHDINNCTLSWAPGSGKI